MLGVYLTRRDRVFIGVEGEAGPPELSLRCSGAGVLGPAPLPREGEGGSERRCEASSSSSSPRAASPPAASLAIALTSVHCGVPATRAGTPTERSAAAKKMAVEVQLVVLVVQQD